MADREVNNSIVNCLDSGNGVAQITLGQERQGEEPSQEIVQTSYSFSTSPSLSPSVSSSDDDSIEETAAILADFSDTMKMVLRRPTIDSNVHFADYCANRMYKILQGKSREQQERIMRIVMDTFDKVSDL